MNETVLAPELSLLLLLKQNNEQALASLMGMYYDNLFNYGLGFTKDSDLVKDCIQEVFLSLWQRRESADSILAPKFYFLRAIKNKILKALSKNSRIVPLDNLAGGYDFFHDVSSEEMLIQRNIGENKARAIAELFSRLTQRQREVIYLKYCQYLDHVQIAELMNISRQSVYNLLHETLHSLRKLIQSNFVTQ
jgi:RNA polymerase sigma factor (sigma-70 family)